MCPGRSCSIFGACEISRSSIATSTSQNAPTRRETDEPHRHLKLNKLIASPLSPTSDHEDV